LNIGNLNIGNTTAASLNIGNLNIGNLNIGNLNIGNLNIGNSPVSDATYAVTNLGNTTHSYRVSLYGNNPNNTPLQLVVTKNSTAPTSVGCALQSVPQGIVLARADNPPIFSSLPAAANPDILGAANATVPIRPGETVFVTLRGATGQMAQLVQQLTPVITAHGANTGAPASVFVLLLLIQAGNGGVLPAAVVGTPYSTTLTAVGGIGSLTWTLASGALPQGLTLSSGGLISGTPSGSGSFNFTAKVVDSSSPIPQSATQSFTINVSGRATTTSVGFGANPIVVGQTTSVTATVADTQAGGAASSPAGTVTLSGDPALSSGSCTLAPSAPGVSTCSVSITPSSPGPRTISASYPGSATHQSSGGANLLTVNAAGTATSLASSLNPSLQGQAVTFTASIAVSAPGAGSPSGTVSFRDGAAPLGSVALSGGSASFTTSALAAGNHPISASYSGDANFASSVSATLTQVVNPIMPLYTFVGFGNPLATAGTLASPSFSGNQNLGSAVAIKWQLFDSAGHNVTDLSSTTLLQAVANSACSGPPNGAATVLYSPTSGATGGSTFRSSSSGFIFNWDTTSVAPSGPGCYTIVLQLNDGSAARATTLRLR
jgi:hypothetical protein